MAEADSATGGRARARSIPTTPGVYFLLARGGAPVYVGMAANLRRRLADHSRTRRWEAVTGIAWELAATPAGAAAREADLVAGLRPPWNKVVPNFFSYVTLTPVGLRLGGNGEYGCFPHLGRGGTMRPVGDCIDGFDALNRILKVARPDDALIHEFLAGSSDRLLQLPVEMGQPYLELGLVKDRILAARFFRAGPAAMRRLRAAHGQAGLVSRDQFATWMRLGADQAIAATMTAVP